MQNVELLNDEQLCEVEGANPLAIIGLCVALFKVGYDMGRDMAKNGW